MKDFPIVTAEIDSNSHNASIKVSFKDNGRYVKLFDYNPNEVDFRREELVGLTITGALALYRKKDKKFRFSPK